MQYLLQEAGVISNVERHTRTRARVMAGSMKSSPGVSVQPATHTRYKVEFD